jgi:hypothetical protein
MDLQEHKLYDKRDCAMGKRNDSYVLNGWAITESESKTKLMTRQIASAHCESNPNS